MLHTADTRLNEQRETREDKEGGEEAATGVAGAERCSSRASDWPTPGALGFDGCK